MKGLILNLILVFATSTFLIAQTVQHLSVDIPNAQNFYTIQRQSNWCWAACNQMLLNSQGIPETQEQQVVKLFGQIVNQGAGDNYEKAKLALGGTYTVSSGRVVTITPYVSYLGTHKDDPVIIIRALQAEIPIIMATRTHGRVCIGVDYDTDGIKYQITRIRLLNPANSSGIETFAMHQFLQQGLMGFMTFTIN